MTNYDVPNSAEFTYSRVARAIAASIEAGGITGQLPAERDLAQRYGVAYQTIRQAKRVLHERGLVATRVGRGTFVVSG